MTSLVIDKNLNISAYATSPTIQITGGGSVCDSGSSTCVIKVESSVEVTLGGINIVNGTGSGILNMGTLWFLFATISGNSSYYGGGIYSPEGVVHVERSTISGNNASYDGGIFASSVAITGSELFDNDAAEDGGAVHVGNSLPLLESTFDQYLLS